MEAIHIEEERNKDEDIFYPVVKQKQEMVALYSIMGTIPCLP
jgi:hypothetical protein